MCEEKGLLAGFGKVDITPDYVTGLGGYGNAESRFHENVLERVFTTCVALSEGEETILIFSLDVCGCDHPQAEWIRDAVSPITGIPGEKMFFCATHTHSAPSWGGYPNGQRFKQDVLVACIQAAREALADLAPAKLMAAKKEFPGMNFVRHNITANGTYAGSNFGSFKDNPAVGYATEPDRQMVLVKFAREMPKQSITMINWQGHPDCARAAGFENITSGYPGTMRDTLSLYTGDLTVFFTGADGNTNITTRVKADAHGLNWREYGIHMAKLAYEMMQEMAEVEGSGIVTKRMIVEAPIDHSWDHMVPQAEEVFKLWKTVGKPEADALGKTYNFTSCYQAGAICRRAKMEKSTTLEINAFRVGGVGFTTGTYEMFSDAGIAIKANSPYDFTFLITGNSGYIPSSDAYDYRCYEVDTGRFQRGTAEMLVDKYTEMLKEIQ